MPQLPYLLLIEDDADLGYVLQTYLEMHGFEVRWAHDGEEALAFFQARRPDLCLLDIMLPKQDGFAVARTIRQQSDTPIIFLTARRLKIDKLKGFQLGADDYLIKPVDEEELIARIRAILRRTTPAKLVAPSVYHLGQYRFNRTNQTLSLGSKQQVLTEKEAALLHLLCENKNRLLPRTEALQQLWGRSDYFKIGRAHV